MFVTKSRTGIALFTFLSQIHLFDATLTIGKSSAEIKTGDSFSITCLASDLSEAVVFYKGTIEIGRCAKSVFAGFPGLCAAGFSQDITTNITTYSIGSANATFDDGQWTCQHTPETSNTLTITVYGFPTNPVDDNQAYLPNSIDTTVMDSTQFTVNVSECVNPSPTISWSFYEDCDGTSITPIPITSTTSEDQEVVCNSPYSAYKSIVTVTDMKNKVNGDYCYKVRVLVGYPGTSFTDVTLNFTQDLTFICPTATTEMSSTGTSQDQTTSSQNPSVDSFPNNEKTETTIMTTTDCDLTSASLHVSSEVSTSIQTASDTGTSQDQTTSSQNPSVDSVPYTEKTETTIMTTTDSDLTSASLHVSSEVTTPIKTDSDNLTELGVSAIIVFAISGFIFLFLIIILIICCCQCYQKYSKNKASEEFQEIHDDEVPKFWSSFDGHRYGINVFNDSTVHLAHGFNLYQGEHYGGYSVPSTDQIDNFNCRRSGRKNITENPKYKPKQRPGKISYRFPHSIPDNMIHRYDRNRRHTYDLHESNQNTTQFYRGQAVSLPRPSEHRGAFLPDECNKHNRRRSPYTKTCIQNYVPRNLDGLTIYQG